MNLIIVLSFNFLLFNGCLTTNINRKSTSTAKNQLNSINSTKVNVFNEDFQYALFDNSDLIEILQFAKDPRYSNFVINHIFPVKYQNYEFIILADADDAEVYVNQFDRAFRISGHNFYMDIIEYFGKSIRRLRIHFPDDLNDDRLATIYKRVNEYCSESLTHLYLESLKQIAFDQFEKPFSNLVRFAFQLKTDRTGSFESLNSTFPKIQRLYMTYRSSGGNHFNRSRFIESDVPHMEHLKDVRINVDIFNKSNVALIQNQLQNMFEQNPQIDSLLYMPAQNDKFIEVISEHLPNLEKLTINNINLSIEALQLNHVKQLILYTGYPSPLEKLSFPRLEALLMVYWEDYKNEEARGLWLNFFKNHQHIKQLNATLRCNDGFLMLMDELPNLEEINFDAYGTFQFELIDKLIEGHEHLVKIHYKTYFAGGQTNDTTVMEMVNEKYGQQWHVERSSPNWPVLTLEKIN